MGFSNGEAPWSEIERVLSGRAPAPGQAMLGTMERGVRPRVAAARLEPPAGPVVPYAELHCHSAFSFLDGACSPARLVTEAVRLGLSALAVTDHDGLYGAAQLAGAARDLGAEIGTVFGAELSLGLPEPQGGVADPVGTHLLVLARDAEGYRRLSRAISEGQLAGGAKGRPVYDVARLAEWADDHWAILTGCRKGAVRRALAGSCGPDGPAAARRALGELADLFGRQNVYVELTDLPTDSETVELLAGLATTFGLPTVATTGAHYATPADSRLADAMAAVRARTDLDHLDGWLPPPTRFLRSGAEMAYLFRRYPQAVAAAAGLGGQCAFDLRLIAPQLPPFPVPAGHDENSWLRELTYRGGAHRWGTPERNPDAYRRLDRELRTIAELNFPGYFLVVHDLVDFCRTHDILCQGRGSAVTSGVCYALGITPVDAVKYGLVFERFLSPERDGPPDIDIDIESGRREEVIQYAYSRYGRENAALVANVNTYRPKMAVRDMARALGYSPGQQDAFSKSLDGWAPLDRQDTAAIPALVLDLARRIEDLPRHLSIHPGGMVICDRPVADVVPVEWATMADRTILQWDKDDCAAFGLTKFDLLGLGMLTAIHETIDLVREHEGVEIDLAQLDMEEPAVYDMLCRADSVGVFQVESRAQMATLPRLKPRRFYDLAVEVALIRPGPIQGGSVHPFIRRHSGLEKPTVEHPAMWPALAKTLGVPLFQEQLMELAVDLAGFGAGEADELRRAMGSKRSAARMEKLRGRLYEGMKRLHNVQPPLADRIFEKLLAFANYGFAESHALAFAGLVFQSSWLKLHHPAAFCAGLLRAQPMGFYSPQSLVADVRRHGVAVLRPHINRSGAKADLERREDGALAIRLGLDGVRTIGPDLAQNLIGHRPPGGYTSVDELTLAVQLTVEQAEALATAGALDDLAGARGSRSSRRSALWSAGAGARNRPGQLPGTAGANVPPPALPGMSDIELAAADMWATGITPDLHPAEFSRPALDRIGAVTTSALAAIAPGTRVLVAGAVTHRQRPATTTGITFINLEDETGMVNVICSRGLWSRYRHIARSARGLLVRGILESQDGAISLIADRLAAVPLAVDASSRDFR